VALALALLVVAACVFAAFDLVVSIIGWAFGKLLGVLLIVFVVGIIGVPVLEGLVHNGAAVIQQLVK
jgi:hypothetical protein